jgi:hypothetical protein
MLPLYPLDGFKALDLFLKPGNPYSRFMYRYRKFRHSGTGAYQQDVQLRQPRLPQYLLLGHYLINLYDSAGDLMAKYINSTIEET